MGKVLKFLLGLVVLAGVGAGAVYGYQYYVEHFGGVNPEAVLPKDSSVVVVLNHSDSGQIKNLRKALEKFPKTEGIDYLIQQYDESADDALKYGKVKDIFENKWKVAVGVQLGTTKGTTSFNSNDGSNVAYAALISPIEEEVLTPEPDLAGDVKIIPSNSSVNFVVAAYFEEADKVEELIKTETKDTAEYAEKDGIKYWDDEVNDLYIFRSGDMFVFTESLDTEKAAVERMKNKDGFSAKIDNKNLAYVYVSAEFLKDVAQDSVAGIGETYSVLSVDGDGFKTAASSTITSKDSPIIKALSAATKLEFVNKVNADGIIAYFEIPSLDFIMQTLAMGAFSAERAAGVYTNNASADDVYVEMAKSLEVDKDDLKKLFNAPFAFALSNDGKFYPSVSFYLKVSDETQEVAEKFVAALNTFMEKTMDEFQGNVRGDSGGSSIISPTNERDSFIAAAIDATCLVFEAPNASDPKIQSQVKAIYQDYGFDYNDGSVGKIMTDKYSKDAYVSKAIKDGITAKCGDVAGLDQSSVTPPTLNLSATKNTTDEEPISFVKSEKITSNGMDLTKWSVNWDLFPESELADANSAFKDMLGVEEGVKALKIGLYYGFAEDGVITLSVSPNFENTYGKNPLANDPLYKEGMSKLNGEGWTTTSYFVPDNLFVIVDNYMVLVKSNPFLAEIGTKVYDTVYGIMTTFKYFVNGQKVDGDALVSSGYTKVEKNEAVKEEDDSDDAVDSDTVSDDTTDDAPVEDDVLTIDDVPGADDDVTTIDDIPESSDATDDAPKEPIKRIKK
ncbi:MAG: hypothetical protein WC269_02075 [Candidatus Gracilibacteria bacterium]|jgi:hypothetical protein